MSAEKFDRVEDDYLARFVEPNRVFYDEVKKRLSERVGKSLSEIILDIGAGPGVVARLLDEADLMGHVVGWEPSNLHKQGVELQQKLDKERRGVVYTPFQGDFRAALSNMIDMGWQYDAITFVRSAHEIAESSSRDSFFRQLQLASGFVKPGGMILVADPMYTLEASSNPEIIRSVREIQQRTLGHSHIPGDYINPFSILHILRNQGFRRYTTKVLPHPALQSVAEAYSLKQTPIVFHVTDYVRTH